MKLFLFDLDGTLVNTGGAGLRALDRAFESHYGFSGVSARISPSGKTDPAIFREIASVVAGTALSDDDLRAVSASYLRFLADEVDASPTYRVLDGVEAFLDRLARRDDAAVGLGTGNLEAGARLKLRRSGLNSYFAFGGFGSDAEDRAELLRVARRRAEALHGVRFAERSVFVIGDTPLDVAAARRAGFTAVAVEGGSASRDALQASLPDTLLSGLPAAPAWLDALEETSGANAA